ncbi:hypothetical protein NMG60_11021890 [Bertholletia excelsa]
MGSNYYGEPNLGNERSSFGPPRRGKKGNSDKPKLPQRGLGVAQLEKIRIQSQMGSPYLPPFYPSYPANQEDMRLHAGYPSVPSSSSFAISSPSSSNNGFRGHQNIMMGMGESDRGNIVYADSQPSAPPSWNPGNGGLENQSLGQPGTTRYYFLTPQEDSLLKRRKKGRGDLMGSGSETNDSQEPDLELRL